MTEEERVLLQSLLIALKTLHQDFVVLWEMLAGPQPTKIPTEKLCRDCKKREILPEHHLCQVCLDVWNIKGVYPERNYSDSRQSCAMCGAIILRWGESSTPDRISFFEAAQWKGKFYCVDCFFSFKKTIIQLPNDG